MGTYLPVRCKVKLLHRLGEISISGYTYRFGASQNCSTDWGRSRILGTLTGLVQVRTAPPIGGDLDSRESRCCLWLSGT